MDQQALNLEFEVAKLPEKLADALRASYQRGYRYVARDKDSEYVCCFSQKPKRYQDGEFWGYKDSEAPGVLPASPIRDYGVLGVRWSDKSALLLEYFLD